MIRIRGSQYAGSVGNNVYNNVIHVNAANAYYAVQIRGMSDGSSGSDNNRVYNNTIHYDGYGPSQDSVFFMGDDSDGNEIFNNLIITNSDIPYLVGAWSFFGGSGNVLQYNVIGPGVITDANMLESSADSGQFSTNANNVEGVTISDYVKLTGSRPAQYYDLKAAYSGTGSIPTVDYSGNSRSSPPDVGAFENDSGETTTTTTTTTTSTSSTISTTSSTEPGATTHSTTSSSSTSSTASTTVSTTSSTESTSGVDHYRCIRNSSGLWLLNV